MKSTAIILAAGMGTRMKSKLPKVMHPVCGKPMIGWIIDSVKNSGMTQTITVLGHGSGIVGEYIGDKSQIVYQEKQLGTGHAVMVAAELLAEEDGVVMVLCGDTPLLRQETLKEMLQVHNDAQATVELYQRLVEHYYNEDAFAPKPLEFKVKKESPITKAQKERLTLLLAKHNLEPKCEITSMTRNEASRYMDQILATYGR